MGDVEEYHKKINRAKNDILSLIPDKHRWLVSTNIELIELCSANIQLIKEIERLEKKEKKLLDK